MNGATAVPWVSTISPPNSAIIRMIGKSQYCLRERLKCQSSATKVIAVPSELISISRFDRCLARGQRHDRHLNPGIAAAGEDQWTTLSKPSNCALTTKRTVMDV